MLHIEVPTPQQCLINDCVYWIAQILSGNLVMVFHIALEYTNINIALKEINIASTRSYSYLDTSVSEGFFSEVFGNILQTGDCYQKLETHPVKSYITKQLLDNGM